MDNNLLEIVEETGQLESNLQEKIMANKKRLRKVVCSKRWRRVGS